MRNHQHATHAHPCIPYRHGSGASSRVDGQPGTSSSEQTEKLHENEQRTARVKEHGAKVEVELLKMCDGIFALMDKNLAPSASERESKVFYHEMEGDYHGHFAEFAEGDAENSRETFARDPPCPIVRETESLCLPTRGPSESRRGERDGTVSHQQAGVLNLDGASKSAQLRVKETILLVCCVHGFSCAFERFRR